LRTRRWLWGTLVVVGVLALTVWTLWGRDWSAGMRPPEGAARAPGASQAQRSAVSPVAPRPGAGLRIRGTVVDPKGAPVAGVRVSAAAPEPGQTLSELPCPEGWHQPYEDPRDASTRGRKLPECIEAMQESLLELIGAREGEAPLYAETTTDTEGTFVLESLPDSPLVLWALGEHGAVRRTGIPAGTEGVTLQLDEGHRVRGTVTGEGAPVADARVTVVDVTLPRFFDATTGPDGSFHVGPVPRGGSYHALVTKEGWLPELFLLQVEHEQVTLHRPSRLSVRVMSGGAAAPDAEVRLAAGAKAPDDDTPALPVDAQGRVTRMLPPGEYTLTAAREGRYALARVTLGAATPEVVLDLGSALHVEGTVTDTSGRPVAGATVTATQLPSGSSRNAATRADGRYRLGPVEPGAWTFEVQAPGYLHVEEEDAEEARTLGPATGLVDFTLTPAFTVSGRVTDSAGQPVPGIQLTFGRSASSSDDGERVLFLGNTWTEEDGRFSVDAEAPGDYRIEVLDKTLVEASFPVRAPSTDVHLTVERGASVEGTLTDAQGVRLEGFLVEVQAPDGPGDEDLWRGERTDANGHFLLQGLKPGPFVLLASREAQSAARRAYREVTLVAGTRLKADLRMEPERTLSGVVVDGGGKPLEGAFVRARPPQKGGPAWKREGRRNRHHGPPLGLTTGADGRFTLTGLTEPEYDVRVWKAGYTLAPGRSTGGTEGEEGMLRVGAGPADVRLVMARDAHFVGRLVDPDGAPLTRFEVNGSAEEDPDGDFSVPIESVLSEALTFEAEGLPPKVVRVDARPAGSDVDLGVVRMSRGRRVHGRVVDAETGAPVPDAELQLVTRDTGAPYPRLAMDTWSVDEHGAFDLARVDLESFTLTVSAEGYQPQALTVPPGKEAMLVRLNSGARVEVTVKDRQGRLRSAVVEFHGEDDDVTTELAHKGRLVQRGLKPGPYTVRLSSPKSQDPRFPVFHPRHVVLPESGSVALTFQEAVGGATVKLRVAGGTSSYIMLLPGRVPPPPRQEAVEEYFAQSLSVEQPEEEATFRQVPPGPATVFFLHPDGPQRYHHEVLDIPAEGTLTRELAPVWRSFAAAPE
jgi:protocatechuate 3,4-dioxygenase beta subunit